MIVNLLTEHYFEFLSLKGGCRGLSESTLFNMLKCWKSHAVAHFIILLVIKKPGKGVHVLFQSVINLNCHIVFCASDQH